MFHSWAQTTFKPPSSFPFPIWHNLPRCILCISPSVGVGVMFRFQTDIYILYIYIFYHLFAAFQVDTIILNAK